MEWKYRKMGEPDDIGRKEEEERWKEEEKKLKVK